MANNSIEDHPLAPFTRLSSCVYIQEPDGAAKHTGDHPRTIVLAFWMNAPPRALAKYVVEYRRLAPSARIIFILSSSNDFILRITRSAQHARVALAVQAIRASSHPENPVFLHMFSNGGVSSATHLLAAYQQLTGKPLRVSSMIIDSAPGTATVTAAMRAFSFALPRMLILRYLSKMVLYAFLVLHALFRKLTRTRDAITLAREEINDHRLLHGVDPRSNLKRCYIYSDADELVDWKYVERHASDAESKGWPVRREKFLGSPHVGHMRADPKRYWTIVRRHLQQSRSG